MTNTGDASAPKARTGDGRLPGDLDARALVERIIRVDHAGEYGARRIYDGQLAVLGRGSPAHAAIRAMAEQERRHLAAFDTLVADRRVRPTALMPLWHVAGFALGAATALLGERAAMACTIAVEEVIDEHYAKQTAALGDDEAELRGRLEEFRGHELEHKAVAEAHHGREAGGYALLSAAIKTGSRLAIWLSERV
ncbi:MAG TPA: demethoxyubiquinone hydroxylase family protein [Candidatus Sulfotelmatobacter sp.]|nr:demethoxyubiquinone hydroxylase family protein [Candidatus Sulfotelmatobacter sp.]